MNNPERGAILVTGAGRRIGRAIALEMARAGHPIAVHYNHSENDAAKTVDLIEAEEGSALAVCAALDDPAAPGRLIDQCVADFGSLTGLVNNASMFERDTIDTLTPQSWAVHLDINLRAPVLLSQAFARALEPGGDGVIVNIIDQRVWNLTPDYVSYTVSKAGLWTVTQTLAQALAPHIRVNAVGPGPTLANANQSDAEFERESRATPLGRPVAPEEIARAVRFLFEASAMTGQMLALDSGQHLG